MDLPAEDRKPNTPEEGFGLLSRDAWMEVMGFANTQSLGRLAQASSRLQGLTRLTWQQRFQKDFAWFFDLHFRQEAENAWWEDAFADFRALLTEIKADPNKPKRWESYYYQAKQLYSKLKTNCADHLRSNQQAEYMHSSLLLRGCINAITNNNLLALKVYFLAGADLGAKDLAFNAVHHAKPPNMDILLFLIDRGEPAYLVWSHALVCEKSWICDCLLEATIRPNHKNLAEALNQGLFKYADAMVEMGLNINQLSTATTPIIHRFLLGFRFNSFSIERHVLIAKCIDLGANLEQLNREGDTELLSAVRMGQEECVEALVAGGVDCKAANTQSGDTACHLAVLNADFEILGLLDHYQKLFLETKNNAGLTPVQVAARMCRFDIVEWLCARGANMDTVFDDVKPSRLMAVKFKNETLKDWWGNLHRIYLKLLDSEPSPRELISFLKLLQQQAKDRLDKIFKIKPDQYHEITDNLWTKREVEDDLQLLWLTGADRREAFRQECRAARGDEFPIVEWMVECGADVCWMHLSSMRNSLFAFLLKHGFDVNYMDENNPPRLYFVLDLAFDLGVVRALIKAGADVNKPAMGGDTVLMKAIEYRRHIAEPELLDMFYEAGADVDQQDDDGQTALHCAAWRGDLDAIEFLAGKYAKLDVVDKDGQTPLLKAAVFCKQQIVRDTGGFQKSFKAMARLAELGANLGVIDSFGNSLEDLIGSDLTEKLHSAAKHGLYRG